MAIINVRDIHDDLDRYRDLDSELALIEAKDIIQRLQSRQPGSVDHLAAFTDAVDHLIEEGVKLSPARTQRLARAVQCYAPSATEQ